MQKFMPIFVTLMNITKAFKPKIMDDLSITLDDCHKCLYIMRIENHILSETLRVLRECVPGEETTTYINEITDFIKNNDENIAVLLKGLNKEVN
jgi:hypothetical protein